MFNVNLLAFSQVSCFIVIMIYMFKTSNISGLDNCLKCTIISIYFFGWLTKMFGLGNELHVSDFINLYIPTK